MNAEIKNVKLLLTNRYGWITSRKSNTRDNWYPTINRKSIY